MVGRIAVTCPKPQPICRQKRRRVCVGSEIGLQQMKVARPGITCSIHHPRKIQLKTAQCMAKGMIEEDPQHAELS